MKTVISLWTKFKVAAEQQGLWVKDCGHGHWQVEGGDFLVNWYPTSNGRTVYISGTNSKASFSSNDPEKVVAAALTPPARLPKALKDRRGGNTRSKKRQLLKKNPFCYWCKKILNINTATIEHIIPLDRGGLENKSNRTLACKPCNHGRGHL